MAQEEIDGLPQRGALLRRAHELLESIGQPVSEDLLLQHLFGVTECGDEYSSRPTQHALWIMLLRRTLKSSSLFEQINEQAIDEQTELEAPQWVLSAWRSTQQHLSEAEFVILDTETTGLRPGPDRVIELAGIRMRGGEVVSSFSSLVNPGRRLPLFIVKFPGITQEMVTYAPKAQEVFPSFLHFIDGAILVGHNIGFDIGFLSYEARLLGRNFPIDGLDTIALARRFLPVLRRFKLDIVAEHLKIPAANRHRAVGDAKVTAAIFVRLLELAQQQGI